MSKLTGVDSSPDFFDLAFAAAVLGFVGVGDGAGVLSGAGSAFNSNVTGGGRIRLTAMGRSIQSMIEKIGKKICLPWLLV